MRRHFDNFLAGAINWIWRKRSKGLTLIRINIPVLVALLGTSCAMEIIVPTTSGLFKLSFDMNQGTPAYLIVVCLILSVLLIEVGIVLLIIEQRRLGKKRVVAIELRGLRDTAGRSIEGQYFAQYPWPQRTNSGEYPKIRWSHFQSRRSTSAGRSLANIHCSFGGGC